LRDLGVQALDHPAVERGGAFRGVLRRVEGGEEFARPCEFSGPVIRSRPAKNDAGASDVLPQNIATG
jgi:hypothetical protein